MNGLAASGLVSFQCCPTCIRTILSSLFFLKKGGQKLERFTFDIYVCTSVNGHLSLSIPFYANMPAFLILFAFLKCDKLFAIKMVELMPIERSDMIGNTPVAFQLGNDHIRH